MIFGIEELQEKINKMGLVASNKVVAQSLRAALIPMLNQARANAPTGKKAHRTYKGRLVAPGFLKRNIKLKKLRRKDKGQVAYGIWAQGEAWYGQLIETGWRAGKRSREAKSISRRALRTKRGLRVARQRVDVSNFRETRRMVRPKPWLGPAYKQHKDAVTKTFIDEIKRRLSRAMR